jgi:phosphoglycerate dehydrogenase-like enzyme
MRFAGKRIACAAIDVWWQYRTPVEPNRRPSRQPFHELLNGLMTPHCSGLTDGTAERRWSARGEPLQNVVVQT